MAEGNSLFNNFSFIGRLCNTPEKKVCKQGRVLFTQFLLKTKFGKKDVRIPLSMFGSCVDIVCTKYKIGDVVAVSGRVNSSENSDGELKIDFVCGEIKLLKKTTTVPAIEDRFKTIVALYDTDNVTNRLTTKKRR